MVISSKNRTALVAKLMVCLAGTVILTQSAWAGGELELSQSLTEHQVDQTHLDTLRGGMQVNGLNVDLGIERAVYVNGVLQGTANFQWNNGATSILSAPTTLMVQNSVPHQALQVTTTINAEVTNLAMYRAIRNTEALTQAIIGGIR